MIKRKYNVVRKGRVIHTIKVNSLTMPIVNNLLSAGYSLAGNYKRV